MPMELLRDLADENTFPLPVIDEASIDKLRVLRAAGMVEVHLPDMPDQPAHVLTITGLGRATLRAQLAQQVIALRHKAPADPHPLAG